MNQTHVPWISSWSQLTPAYKRHNKGPSLQRKTSWARQGVSSAPEGLYQTNRVSCYHNTTDSSIPFVCFFMRDFASLSARSTVHFSSPWIWSWPFAFLSPVGYQRIWRRLWPLKKVSAAGLAVILGSTFPVTPTYANTAARHKTKAFLDKLHDGRSPPGETSRTTMLSPAPTADPHNRELNDYSVINMGCALSCK